MIIRSDDFDFRLSPDEYIENHEKFIKAELTETAVIQFTQHGNIPDYSKIQKLFEYMKTTPYWDIQLHGWAHEMYGELPYGEVYKQLAASLYMMDKLFGIKPTVWYPPWNNTSPEMEKAASEFGLKVNAESHDISSFIREMKDGDFKGNVVYYHLWNYTEAAQIDDMIKYAKEYENRRQ